MPRYCPLVRLVCLFICLSGGVGAWQKVLDWVGGDEFATFQVLLCVDAQIS